MLIYKKTFENHHHHQQVYFRQVGLYHSIYITSCRRAAATICPRPSFPPWAPKRLPPPSRRQRQRSSSFPRPTRAHAHRCSRLTRQHSGEQSSLVTLTLDLLILKVMSESRVTWATFVLILVFLGLSVSTYARCTRQTSDRETDVRQKHRLVPPPIRGGGIKHRTQTNCIKT